MKVKTERQTPTQATGGVASAPARTVGRSLGFDDGRRLLATTGGLDPVGDGAAVAKGVGPKATPGSTVALHNLVNGAAPILRAAPSEVAAIATPERAPSEAPLVVVAGATGNAGREIVRALKERGCRVRALVRDPEGLRDVKGLCDEIKVVQITDPRSISGVMDGASFMVSAVGKTRQTDGSNRRDVDVDANLALFAEAKKAGVGRISFVSVFGAAHDAPAVLGRMKAEAEDGLKATGVPYNIIRPTGYFTDLWEIMEMAKKGTVMQLGDGANPMNPISMPDLGAKVADTLLDEKAANRTISVGGPETLPMRDLAKVCERALGREVKVRAVPRWLAKLGVAILGLFDKNKWEAAQSVLNGPYGTQPMVGEPTGTIRLEDYFRARLAAEGHRSA